ncbi:MAG: pilus assembly protein PilM [Planctomycetota bacterium]
MVSACGIHIDQRRFRLIALEGSPKKHKIVAHVAGEIPPGADPAAAVGSALRALVKREKLRRENVGLAVSSGLAAFRSLTLPFDDRAKIEDVLKFEIESDLPQWNIDDVIVDFLVIDAKPGVQSDLLVTAIPKESLAPKLAACEKAGLEAAEAELDGTALFDAAREAGVLGPDSAQVLVYVGDSSTTVVLADGGKLVSMRAIRAGAQPLDGLPAEEAAAAGDEAGEAEAAGPDDPLASAPAEPAVDPARIERTIQRIRRELARTISGARTTHPIDGVYVGGRELPGFSGEAILDAPMLALAGLPAGADVPAPSEMIVAYGAALHQLGSGLLRPHLRREDLRFTGTFERLELPLAVFSLLLVTLLAVRFIVLDRQIKWREQNLQTWLESSNTFMLPSSKLPARADAEPYPGRLKDPSDALVAYCLKAQADEDPDRTKWEQIDEIRKILLREIDAKKKELGQKRDFEPPISALQALTTVLCAIDDLGEQVGRIALRGVNADYMVGKRNNPDDVVVKLDIDFLAENDVVATSHFTNLLQAFRAEPWCVEFEEKPTKTIDGGGGISVDDMTIHVIPDRGVVTPAEEAKDSTP